ncbi:MAG: glycosyltransferase 87 family protein [Gemmataceae bacterium]|nr:glycosyltransferase 87 family protein [Gemmataceae bacterium]
MTDPDRLRPWERAGLLLVLLVVVAFGAVVELRSAFQSSRRTDLGVYTRAGWAALNGGDLYSHVDDHGWHYCYPPPFAVLMIPLAEPPPDLPRAGTLPFPVSVAVWYVLSVGCLAYAVHAFAGAVLPGDRRWSRRWWYARTIPVYVCLGGVGHTLGRGQVNLFVVALVAAAFAASVRGRRLASGAWLAAAATVKVIPGLLVVDPLVRRDWRALAGGVVAAVVLLGVVPAVVWGPARAVELNKTMAAAVLAPALSSGADRTRAEELHGARATDSQSVRAAVQAWLYPDRDTRPDEPDPRAAAAHWLSGGVMLAVTALVGVRRLTAAPADRLVYLGCLCVLMLLLTPVSHMHYYAFALPLVAGLWLRGLARRPGAACADGRTVAALVGWGVLTAVPLFPGPVFDRLRECGLGPAATIALWAFGLATLARPRDSDFLPSALTPGRWITRRPVLPARSTRR